MHDRLQGYPRFCAHMNIFIFFEFVSRSFPPIKRHGWYLCKNYHVYVTQVTQQMKYVFVYGSQMNW